MSIPFNTSPFFILQILTAGFCSFFAFNLFNRNDVSGANRLSTLMAILGIWAFTAGMESAFLTFEAKLISSKIKYVCAQSVAPLLFVFSTEYSNRKHYWINRWNQVILWAIPIATIVLLATNEYHNLIWTNIQTNQNEMYSTLIISYGIGFWISTFYHYLLVALAGILLVIGTKEKKQKRQFGQISLIIVSLAISWVTNIAYVFGLTPVPGMDITPVTFTITLSLGYMAFYPTHFLDLSPIARSKLVDNMSDAFFVFDGDNYLADINPAGQVLLKQDFVSINSAPVEEVFARWPNLVEQIINPSMEEDNDLVIQDNDTAWYDVRIAPLAKGKIGQPGCLVIFHNISQIKMVERELEQQAAGLRTVSEISLTIASSKLPQSMLQDIVELTAQRFGFNYVQIFLLEPQSEVLQLAAGSGEIGQALLKKHYALPLDDEKSIISQVARERYAMIVDDIHHNDKYYPHQSLTNTQSEIAIPIIYQEKLLGVLDIQSDQVKHFGERDLHIQSTLAAQISVALMNARLFDDLNRRAKEAETLRQASSVVVSTLQQDKAIELILEQLKQVVPYDNSSVQLLKEQHMEIVGGIGFSETDNVIGLRYPLTGASASAKVFQTKQPIIIQDVQTEYPEFLNYQPGAIRGWMGVPLFVQNEVIGVITLGSYTPAAFQQSQARLVQAFADHVAIALENTRLFEDTRRLAIMDPLTNIYNRRHFYELAHAEFERFSRYHRPLSAIIFDLDRFKRVNDTYGHAVGDLVLKSVAENCRVQLRINDIFARYGGEEFVIVMPETDEQEALIVAERLRCCVARTPLLINDEKIRITISLGVATLLKEHLTTGFSGDLLEKLIDHADQALYLAKKAGRNRVVAFGFKDVP